VRVDGLCNRSAPPRHSIDGGSEILCHHDSVELLKTQRDVINLSQGAYA
jgi:peptide/nickel transport system ATP-binding protein